MGRFDAITTVAEEWGAGADRSEGIRRSPRRQRYTDRNSMEGRKTTRRNRGEG